MTFEQRVCSIIKKIPEGKVATYGQVAALAGSPRAARSVGMILRHQDNDLPWQRVINRRGRISILNLSYPAVIQAELLRQEGIRVEQRSGEYFVDLRVFLWKA
ncbi:MAG: MGMT family protein [Patescibacteria group bacterium]